MLFSENKYDDDDSMVYVIVMCLCIHLSQADIVSKWLNVESWKQCHTIAQGF